MKSKRSPRLFKTIPNGPLITKRQLMSRKDGDFQSAAQRLNESQAMLLALCVNSPDGILTVPMSTFSLIENGARLKVDHDHDRRLVIMTYLPPVEPNDTDTETLSGAATSKEGDDLPANQQDDAVAATAPTRQGD